MIDHPAPPRRDTSGVWYLTFADVVSLLLTFFVMLYAMSSVKTDEWRELSDALSRQSQTSDSEASPPTARHNIASVFRKRAINLEYLQAVFDERLADDPAIATARTHLGSDRLVVSLPGEVLFAPSGAALDDAATQALFAVGGLLVNITNPVAVLGHAEPGAVPSEAFTSAWELSLARAAAVANVLRRAGYTRDVIIQGAGEGRLRDASDRDAANRVDIVILSGALESF